ncbi:hypothetical protein SK128_022752 [Halocaridina rubra]|uniref:Uncharacterized protein n=1 Tax=Halocaridina rubra TaxID=373956 RepID=A0AAN8WGP4_HALRR
MKRTDGLPNGQSPFAFWVFDRPVAAEELTGVASTSKEKITWQARKANTETNITCTTDSSNLLQLYNGFQHFDFNDLYNDMTSTMASNTSILMTTTNGMTSTMASNTSIWLMIIDKGIT